MAGFLGRGFNSRRLHQYKSIIIIVLPAYSAPRDFYVPGGVLQFWVVLVIYRRHKANCSKAGTRTQDCPSKPKCPIHFEGVDGAGIRRKRRALVDPATAGGVRDWNRAVEIIRELELPAP